MERRVHLVRTLTGCAKRTRCQLDNDHNLPLHTQFFDRLSYLKSPDLLSRFRTSRTVRLCQSNPAASTLDCNSAAGTEVDSVNDSFKTPMTRSTSMSVFSGPVDGELLVKFSMTPIVSVSLLGSLMVLETRRVSNF